VSSANAWMHYHTRREGRILATQSRARELTAEEANLANALEQLFATGTHDFTDIAVQLTQRSIPVPGQSHCQWTLEILASTLNSINTDLDSIYDTDGFGA